MLNVLTHYSETFPSKDAHPDPTLTLSLTKQPGRLCNPEDALRLKKRDETNKRM